MTTVSKMPTKIWGESKLFDKSRFPFSLTVVASIFRRDAFPSENPNIKEFEDLCAFSTSRNLS